MTLREWLFYNRKMIKDMAKDLEINPLYLGQIKNGRHKPSVKMAKQIERYTGGEVSYLDLII